MSGLAQIRQSKEDLVSGEILPSADAKIPYLYITGTGHSGSTLLAFLLNAHPQMVSISEIGPGPGIQIKNYRCSCGSFLRECPFFVELEGRINAMGCSFSLTSWETQFLLSEFRVLNILLARPLRFDLLERTRDRIAPFWPGYRHKTGQIAERTVYLAGSALAISGKKIFVDAQKDPIRTKFLSRIERLDLKVIHLIKDVRGFAASRIKAGRMTASSAARTWRDTNMASDRTRRYVSPDRWMRVTYEELCSETQQTIDRISAFVRVARAPIPKDFYQTEHHIIGNHMRRKGPGAGVVRLDESWKDRLREQDLKTIARIAGRANRYFGYDWP